MVNFFEKFPFLFTISYLFFILFHCLNEYYHSFSFIFSLNFLIILRTVYWFFLFIWGPLCVLFPLKSWFFILAACITCPNQQSSVSMVTKSFSSFHSIIFLWFNHHHHHHRQFLPGLWGVVINVFWWTTVSD